MSREKVRCLIFGNRFSARISNSRSVNPSKLSSGESAVKKLIVSRSSLDSSCRSEVIIYRVVTCSAEITTQGIKSHVITGKEIKSMDLIVRASALTLS